MACKKGGEIAAKSGIAELAKRVPPNQILQFKDFQAKHAEYLTRVNKQPEKLPNIDWEHYRRNVRTEFVKMVNEFEQKYKGVCEAYDRRGQQDKSKYFVEIDKLKQQVQAEVEKYKAESNERIKALEAKYVSVQALKPYEEMTAEEYSELLPDKSFFMYQGHPSFWPHTEDEQGPGPSSKEAHGHDEHGGHGGGEGGHGGGEGGNSGGASGAAAPKSVAEPDRKTPAEDSSKTDKKPNETASIKTAGVESCLNSKQFKDGLSKLKECSEKVSNENDNKNNEESKKAKTNTFQATSADYGKLYIFGQSKIEKPTLAQTVISAYQSTELMKPSSKVNESSAMKAVSFKEIASGKTTHIENVVTALSEAEKLLAEFTPITAALKESSQLTEIEPLRDLSKSTTIADFLNLDPIKPIAKSNPQAERSVADVKLKDPTTSKSARINLATSIGVAQKGGQPVISLIRSESTQANTSTETDKLKKEMSNLAKITVDLFSQIAKVEAALIVRSPVVKASSLNKESSAKKADGMRATASEFTKQKDINSAATQLKGNLNNSEKMLEEVTSTTVFNAKVPKKDERVMSSKVLRQNTLTVDKLSGDSGIVAGITTTSEETSPKGAQTVIASVRSEVAELKIVTESEKYKQHISDLMKYTVEYFGQLAEAEENHKKLRKSDNKEDMERPLKMGNVSKPDS